MSRSECILVVGPSWVGDMVMAQSLLRRLERELDHADIDVVAPAWSVGLVERMKEVRKPIVLDVSHGELALRKRRALGRSLRGLYSRAIVLPRSLKAALVPYFAAIPRRTGYRGEHRFGLLNDIRPFDAELLDQTVKRFVALAPGATPDDVGEIPLPALAVDETRLGQLRQRFELDTAGPVAAFMAGAEYGPAKQWPVESFAELARRLTGAGVSIWLLGSAKETDIAAAIAAAAPGERVRNLCGRTALNDAVDLLSAVDVAVTNDSGLMHIAAAVGAHVVAIYGSSTPDFTPPLTATKTVLYERLACSPCFERRCPLGHLDCLRSIDVETVERAVHAALERRGDRVRRAADAGMLEVQSDD